MKELIKIRTNEEGKKLVSARELHEFLESKERFSKWFEKMLKYGFELNEEYTPYQMVHPQNNQTIDDYIVTIEMAKELSMVSRLEKGKEARRYFIRCEKKLKEVSKKALLLETIYNGGQEGILASKKLTEIEVEEATTPLLDKIEEDKPLVEFSNQISRSVNAIEIGKFAKVVKDEHINLGRNKLFQWLRDNKYLMKDNTPYQDKVNQGLFELEEYTYNTPYGEKLATKSLITGKGQIYIVEKLRKEYIN